MLLCHKIVTNETIPILNNLHKRMYVEAYLLWKNMWQFVVANWNQFIDSYAFLFGRSKPYNLAYTERISKGNNDSNIYNHSTHEITVYVFISFTRKPFKKDIAIVLLVTEPHILRRANGNNHDGNVNDCLFWTRDARAPCWTLCLDQSD